MNKAYASPLIDDIKFNQKFAFIQNVVMPKTNQSTINLEF